MLIRFAKLIHYSRFRHQPLGTTDFAPLASMVMLLRHQIQNMPACNVKEVACASSVRAFWLTACVGRGSYGGCAGRRIRDLKSRVWW